MSTFIHREIAKIREEEEDIYVCMFLHDDTLLNISFFKKLESGIEELLQHGVSKELGRELVRKVRENEVEKLIPEESKLFNQSLNKYYASISNEIKKIISKTTKDLKVDYIGEVAGINYLVSTNKEVDLTQIYMLQKSKEANGFEVGRMPEPFIEIMILDYIHHFKKVEKPSYFMIGENQFIGIKKSNKHSQIIYVVKIDVFPDSVSATKAYMISKKNLYEYELLPIAKSTPELMESLKKEGSYIINQFVEQMNMIEK